MRKHTYIAIFFLIINIWLTHSSYGYGNKITHPAITSGAVGESTIDGYLKNQLGMVNGIQTQLRYQPDWYQTYIQYRLQRGDYSLGGNNRTILEWMKSGSVIEDEDLDIWPPFLPSIRPRHHFHDPIHNAGLDNKFDHPNYGELFAFTTHYYPGEFDVTGQSAIAWAIKGTAPYQEPTTNAQSWLAARDDFYSALTDSNSLWREYYLAAVFLDLGSVAHMIEDMGVPAHARNDFLFGHYIPPLQLGNDFENWVDGIIKNNGGQSPWSGSSPVVFDKLAEYFDANAYLGDYLGDGVLPPNTWGLSECSNYQFLSTSTMFGCTGIKYQFPNPAKEHLGPNSIVPVPNGKKVYFNGSNYGVPHLARESYTYFVATGWGYYGPLIDNTNTTDDTNVFEDYANITVPRTINYTTGLLNYFFRGKLSIEQTDCNNSKIVITITNKSTNSDVNQTLKGGTFTLYWDDSAGNRTAVSDFTVYQPGTDPVAGNEWNSSTQMNYDQTTKAVFTPPQPQDTNYILVYEGIISSDPNSPDSDDTRQIATGKTQMVIARPSPCNCSWGNECYPYCFEEDKTPHTVMVTFNGVKWCDDSNLIVELNTTFCLSWALGFPDTDYAWQTTVTVNGKIYYIYYRISRPWEISIEVSDGSFENGNEFLFFGYLTWDGRCEISNWSNEDVATIYGGPSGSTGCEGTALITFPKNDGTCDSASPWATSTSYSVGDVVIIDDDPGYCYICDIAHISSSTNRPYTGANWSDYWHRLWSCI